jgi:hypothetical protein
MVQPDSRPDSCSGVPGSADGCEQELAEAIRRGMQRRPEQAYGDYFVGRRASCALGAAYEGMYRLPAEVGGLHPKRLDRLFDCLENTIRSCPEPGCKKRLILAAVIAHLNDSHRWDRERIAAWVSEKRAPLVAPPPPESA